MAGPFGGPFGIDGTNCCGGGGGGYCGDCDLTSYPSLNLTYDWGDGCSGSFGSYTTSYATASTTLTWGGSWYQSDELYNGARIEWGGFSCLNLVYFRYRFQCNVPGSGGQWSLLLAAGTTLTQMRNNWANSTWFDGVRMGPGGTGNWTTVTCSPVYYNRDRNVQGGVTFAYGYTVTS